MGAHVQCPRCEQAYALSDEQALLYAGREFECAQCTFQFIIPATPGARIESGELPRQQMTAAAVRSPAGMAIAYPGWGLYGASDDPPVLSSRLAAASMICGIIGLLVPIVPGILAILLGIWAVARVYSGKAEGAPLAAGGIAVGAAGLVLSSALFYDRLRPALANFASSGPTAAVVCSDHFKTIDGALAKYAAEHGGNFPDGLDALIVAGHLRSDALICPLGSERKATGKTREEVAQRVASGKHSSYVYAGKGLTTKSPPECVLLYEPLTTHDKSGITVLFVDGRVQEIGSIEATKAVARLSRGVNPPWSAPGQ